MDIRHNLYHAITPYMTLYAVSCMAILFCVCIYLYLRLSYGFWFYQPVFHLYDLHYYVFPRGIVDMGMPEKNRFTNTIDIDTLLFADIVRDYRKDKLTNFIRSHYLRNGANAFLPTTQEVLPYFSEHKHPSFASFYKHAKIVENKKMQTMTNVGEIIGVMTSRPLQVSIHFSHASPKKLYAYYVDYLCVHRDHRKKGVAPEIIQTHYHNQRRANPEIFVNLFKREGELTGIVPLCAYPSYAYDILSLSIQEHANEHTLVNVTCNEKNMHFLSDFLKEQSHQFDIHVCSDLSNFIVLLQSGNYFVEYVVDQKQENDVLAVYFFKKTRVYLAKKQEMLACIGSVKSKNMQMPSFIEMFKKSLFSLRSPCTYLLIESLSHNVFITEHLNQTITPVVTSPTAYFFHNYVHHSFSPKRTFILGT